MSNNSIVNHPYRVLASDTFIQQYKEGDKPIYMAYARETEWFDGVPERLSNTLNEAGDFVDNILAMRRIDKTNIVPVIRNYPWESGDTQYTTFDTSSETAHYSKFYTVNSEGRVYLCVEKGSGAVSEEPTGHNNGNDILTNDGYKWQYFYTVTADEYQLYLGRDWIVIHYGADYASDEQKQHGSIYVNVAFGAHHIMFSQKLDDNLKTNVNFHQIGLISTPLDKQLQQITSDIPDVKNMHPDYVRLIYLENHYKIERRIGKHETPHIVVEF